MATQKSPNWGLGNRGPNAPSATNNDVRHFYIIEVHWNKAQPGSSGGTVPPNPLTAISSGTSSTADDISKKVDAVRTYNIANTRTAATVHYTGGSQTLTFTGTDLTGADVGQYIYDYQDVPLGTKITAVNAGAHTATIDTSAHQTGSSIIVGQPQGLRLRIETGQYTPTWAFAGLPGASIQDSKSPPLVMNIPQWWMDTPTQTVLGIPNLGPVQAYYATFISGLASLTVPGHTISGVTFPDYTVDTCPEIREVTVGLTMIEFGETFWRFAGNGNNNANYIAAGYTGTRDHKAMLRMMDIHGACFKNTVTMLDCNGWNGFNISDHAGFPDNMSFTQDILDYCVGAGVYHTQSPVIDGFQITNASMVSGGSNGPLYTIMQNYGPLGTGDAARNQSCAVTFQTYPQGQVTGSNLAATLARAITYGATSIESLSAGGSDTVASIEAVETSSNYDQQFMQNFAPTLPANYPWPPSVTPPPPIGVPAEFPASTTGPGALLR